MWGVFDERDKLLVKKATKGGALSRWIQLTNTHPFSNYTVRKLKKGEK